MLISLSILNELRDGSVVYDSAVDEAETEVS
jgi:hypothetical protein